MKETCWDPSRSENNLFGLFPRSNLDDVFVPFRIEELLEAVTKHSLFAASSSDHEEPSIDLHDSQRNLLNSWVRKDSRLFCLPRDHPILGLSARLGQQ